MDDYLSIIEFAAAAGVSKQAIYKQINNPNSQIAPYLVTIGRKVFVAKIALLELYGIDNTKTTQTTQEVEETTLKVDKTTPKTTPKIEEMSTDSTDATPNVDKATTEKQPTSASDFIEYLKAENAELRAAIVELKADRRRSEQQLNDTIQKRDEVIREKDAIITQQNERLAELTKQVADIAAQALVTTSQQQYLAAAEKHENKRGGWLHRLLSRSGSKDD